MKNKITKSAWWQEWMTWEDPYKDIRSKPCAERTRYENDLIRMESMNSGLWVGRAPKLPTYILGLGVFVVGPMGLMGLIILMVLHK